MILSLFLPLLSLSLSFLQVKTDFQAELASKLFGKRLGGDDDDDDDEESVPVPTEKPKKKKKKEKKPKKESKKSKKKKTEQGKQHDHVTRHMTISRPRRRTVYES